MKFCPRCSEWFGDDAAFCPHDGAGLTKSKDRFLGRTIAARYRLIRRLGAGGMSVVYLARHELIARQSAIKILRPELSLFPEHRERFLREARAVNRINHENIVEITDVGESDGVAYLVMEFVEGESLLATIGRGKPLRGRARLSIGMQVAAALARAHQMGVVHRDLKPDNILLLKHRPDDVEADHVKLTDFGIAKLTGEPSLTMNHQLFGTPGYIAPEYVGGLGIDGRSDIYSLAVVVYELITGELPFEGTGQSDLLLRPLTSAPIPPSRRIEGLPPDLESLLLRCLARDPGHRPHDAFAMHDAFADIIRRFAGSSSRIGIRRSVVPSFRVSEHAGDPTVMDVDATGERGTPAWAPASVADSITRGMSSQWDTALADLEAKIAKVRTKGGTHALAAARAAELATVAAELMPRLTRASAWVVELQARVDRLEARGRDFRMNLGYAIDVLVHDRSRERAHLEALRVRRTELQHAVSGPEGRPSSPAVFSQRGTQLLAPMSRGDEPRSWEADALVTEERRAAQTDADLTFQVEALQKQLDAKNETFEAELVFATGQLEGALSALRRLTSELVRTIDDGVSILERQD